MAKYTVIIPTFNRDKHVSRAIDSVIKQTFKDFRCLVIDDCSTDATTDVLRAKIFEHERLEAYRLNVNSGACIARNIGIKLANSEYVAFLDSDDEWLPTYLEEMNELIENNREEGVACFYSNIGKLSGSKIEKTNTLYGLCGDVSNEVFKFLYICTPTTLICRKEALEKIGGFDPLFSSGCNDDDLCIRLGLRYKFAYLDKLLAIFHEDANERISSNPFGQVFGHHDLLKKFEAEILSRQGAECLLMHYKKLSELMRLRINQNKNLGARL